MVRAVCCGLYGHCGLVVLFLVVMVVIGVAVCFVVVSAGLCDCWL